MSEAEVEVASCPEAYVCPTAIPKQASAIVTGHQSHELHDF